MNKLILISAAVIGILSNALPVIIVCLMVCILSMSKEIKTK